MTIRQMFELVNLKLDKVSSYQTPGFELEELAQFLTSAQNYFIKTRYSGNNPKGEGYEESQKRIDDLRTLVKKANNGNGYKLSDADYNSSQNFYDVTLAKLEAPDYQFLLKDYLRIRNIACPVPTEKIVKIKYMQHDDFAINYNDPFWKPELFYPVKLVDNGFVDLYLGGKIDFTKNEVTYFMTYLSLAPDIVYDKNTYNNEYTVLPVHAHEEVVNAAVLNALEYIEQPRQQTFTREYLNEE